MEPISYEAHITIEPVFGDRFDTFEALSSLYKFKPAELLLQKTRTETPFRSNKDSFCTGHSKTYEDLYARMSDLVSVLKGRGFSVWRAKIEGILFDQKYERLVNIT